jgi:hypothetical protein
MDVSVEEENVGGAMLDLEVRAGSGTDTVIP